MAQPDETKQVIVKHESHCADDSLSYRQLVTLYR